MLRVLLWFRAGCPTMPDPKGRMSQEEFGAAANWLNSKVKNAGTCDRCGEKAGITLEPDIGHLFLPSLRVSWPMLVLMCQNCGSTRLHSAVKAGVITPATSAEEDGNEKP